MTGLCYYRHMNITKFEHACLVLNNQTSRLVIDPGSFTRLPEDLKNISCVVVTEEHVDHYNLENIQKILLKSPEAKVFSTMSVVRQLSSSNIGSEAVTGEQQIEVGNFKLTLKEGDHAPIYGNSPCKVLTVQVDEFLYYPSDSFIPTNTSVQVLALPTSGPWHTIAESIRFADSINSNQLLVTHNGLYNDTGNTVANTFISNNIADKEREYIFLEVGESRDF